MGAEAPCTARIGRRATDGRAWLETDELVFRGGELKLVVPLREVRTARADGGRLILETTDGDVVLELGTAAEAWAYQILHPKGLLEKLGVRRGMKVVVSGVDDDSFRGALTEHLGKPPASRATREVELLFLGVDEPADLERLAALKATLAPAGALWIIRPKGRPSLPEATVRSAARAAGLVDVKVVRFSTSHTADKYVIPKAAR
jgi:hypothetical protein